MPAAEMRVCRASAVRPDCGSARARGVNCGARRRAAPGAGAPMRRGAREPYLVYISALPPARWCVSACEHAFLLFAPTDRREGGRPGLPS